MDHFHTVCKQNVEENLRNVEKCPQILILCTVILRIIQSVSSKVLDAFSDLTYYI